MNKILITECLFFNALLEQSLNFSKEGDKVKLWEESKLTKMFGK